ncbi:hypothetical protein MALG_01662 [Marinovum algicola DG 898]|nr:hypothetical protein MALG_01662 [Marinovum algicola DG 898]
MSTILRAKGNVIAPDGIDSPHQDGLLLSHVFCDLTDGYFHRNFAPGQPDSEIYGTVAPSLSGTAARFTGLSNFIQSKILEPRVGTVLMVASTVDSLADDANRPMFFGTWTGTPRGEATASTTFGLYSRITSASSPNVVRMGAGRGTSVADDVNGDCALLANDVSAPHIYSMTFSEAGPNAAEDHTEGVTASDDSTAPRFPTDQMVRIGSGYAQYTGICDLSIIRLWGKVLTPAAIAEEVAHAEAFMARLGVAV